VKIVVPTSGNLDFKCILKPKLDIFKIPDLECFIIPGI